MTLGRLRCNLIPGFNLNVIREVYDIGTTPNDTGKDCHQRQYVIQQVLKGRRVSQGKISTSSLCNSRSGGPEATRKRGVMLQNDQTMESLQSPAGKRLTENLPYPNLLRSLPQEYWPGLIKANEISATSKAADLLWSLSESEWECEPQRGVNASLLVSTLLCVDEVVITDWNKGTGRNFTIMDL